nr:phosphoribosyltransferase domain-containing protein [uncultured Moraxella sp.]
MTNQKTINLSRGTLTLNYQTKGDYQLDDLLGFAERINPKRAFLFVSKVLGRHIPVAPKIMRQAFSDLADLIPNDLPQPIVVIGMAETAVGLSAGVHQVLQQRYPNAILLNSTRHAQTGELLTTFSEDHSHASQHLIYQSDDKILQNQVFNAKTLIMVDDEASTGQTCQNVVNALRQAGLKQLEQVHLATLVDWSLGKVANNPFNDLAFFRHHLMAGSWQWTDKPNPPSVTMPSLDTTKAGSQPLMATGKWGRFPTLNTTAGVDFLFNHLTQKIDLNAIKNQKILVLGSNEFVWLPFLLAEILEKKGANVKFSALTRSPVAIHEKSAIRSALTFADNYGLGLTNFVYNVVPSEWDKVLLFVETAENSVDNIWQTFDNLLVISPCPNALTMR